MPVALLKSHPGVRVAVGVGGAGVGVLVGTGVGWRICLVAGAHRNFGGLMVTSREPNWSVTRMVGNCCFGQASL